MTTTTQEKAWAFETLRNWMGENPETAPMVYTLTTLGRGETDHVRLFIADGGEIHEMTYRTARVTGQKVKPNGIAYGGGNYNKGLEAADDLWRAMYGEPLDQSKWREL